MLRLRARLFRSSRSTTPGENERGSATLENIIIWPAVMIFLFGVFQVSLWLHARDVAHGAATAAYYEARTLNGTAEAAQTAGSNAVATAEGAINGANISVSRTPETVSVTVSGVTSLIIPGWPGSFVSETVTGPVERYVAP
ncbi:TadE protein [Rathayibacter rathayi]|uniref:TadE/TadG family type IV pilus assembly protein n=1 Tax=Rathayibacter rathayi TaxID=33887 RepID=UPI000CE93614|nr:TadE family protein [Rathayibacter rathayi]PPG77497.1 TadE protein [Rathayibacter rathayi]PPG94333.1 TadE protein [Rathayibacter rathayi]PPI65265.1 TadE protein [Rathayibacter rathayi]